MSRFVCTNCGGTGTHQTLGVLGEVHHDVEGYAYVDVDVALGQLCNHCVNVAELKATEIAEAIKAVLAS